MTPMKNLNVKLPDAVYRHVARRADRAFESKSAYLRRLAIEDMEKMEKDNAKKGNREAGV